MRARALRPKKGAKPRISPNDIVTLALRAAARRHPQDAFNTCVQAAEALRQGGWPRHALELISALPRVIPAFDPPPADLAWLRATEAWCYHGIGNNERARESFSEMMEIGRSIREQAIVSTATQSIAVLEQEAGRPDSARELYKTAFKIKRSLRDHYACIQIIVNLAALELDEGHLARAERRLTASQRLLRGYRSPHLRGSIYGQLGILRVREGRFAEAVTLFRRALVHFSRSGDAVSVIGTLQNLGNAFVEQGRTKDSIASYRGALEMVGRLDLQPKLLGDSLAGLAVALHRSGRHRAAAVELRHLRSLAEQLSERHLWATSTADLGAVLILDQRPREALPLLEEAVSTFITLEDREWQSRALLNILEAWRSIGDRSQVVSAARKALRVLPRQAGGARSDIAHRAAETFLDRPRDVKRAAGYFAMAVNELRRSGDTDLAGREAAIAGARLGQAGACSQAVRFLGVAIRIYDQIRNVEMASHLRNDRAICYADLKQFRAALTDYKHSADLAKRRGDRVLALQVLMNRGETFRRMGRLNAAQRELTRGLRVANALGAVDLRGDILLNLGLTLSGRGAIAEARRCFDEGLLIGRTLHSPAKQATALGGLAGIDFQQGNYRGALRLYRRAARLRRGVGDDRQLVEELAAIVETIAADGGFGKIRGPAQELVNIAQEVGQEELAAESLAQVGRAAMRHHRVSVAADVGATALLLSGASKGVSAREAIRRMSVVGLVLGVSALRHIKAREEEFYDRIRDKLRRQGISWGPIRLLIRMVRREARRLYRRKGNN